jgi:hypothetical protein
MTESEITGAPEGAERCPVAEAATARVFLLLESCGYEGYFVVGVFSTRDRAEGARIKEYRNENRNIKPDRIYQIKELILDATVPKSLRYAKHF